MRKPFTYVQTTIAWVFFVSAALSCWAVATTFIFYVGRAVS